MKRLIVCALLALVFLAPVRAQRPARRPMSTEQRVEMQVRRLDARLNLDDEQEKAIAELYTEFFKQNHPASERKKQVEMLNKKIEALLTDAQKSEFAKMRQERQERPKRGGRRQPQPAN